MLDETYRIALGVGVVVCGVNSKSVRHELRRHRILPVIPCKDGLGGHRYNG